MLKTKTNRITPYWKSFFTLPMGFVLCACADNQIQHCAYGVSDSVAKIEAKLCDGTIIPYSKNIDYWESKEVIKNPCETVLVKFSYVDGRIGQYEGLYMTSGFGEKITDYAKFNTDKPETIHLVKSNRDYELTQCPSEQDVTFTRDFSAGELCDERYYKCDTKD